MPGFADLAVVEVVDGVLRGADPPVGPLPPGTPLRRAASGRCDAFRDTAEGAGEGGARGRSGVTRRLAARTPYALATTDLRARFVPLGPDNPWWPPTPTGRAPSRRPGRTP